MKKFVAITIGLLLTLLLVFAVGAARGWTAPAFYTEWLTRVHAVHGAPGLIVVIVGLLMTDLVLPVPSSIVMTLSGTWLGPVVGFAANFAGSMACTWAGFGLCRWGYRKFGRRWMTQEECTRATAFMEGLGSWAIVVSRGVPMLTEAVSCLAGLTRMRWWHFTALAALGSAPLCAVYAWAGYRAAKPEGSPWALTAAVIVPAAALALARLRSRRSSSTGGHPAPAPTSEGTP